VKATASTTENGLTGCLTATTGLSSMYACNGTELAKTTECAANQAYLDISGLSTATSGDEQLTVNTTPITTGIYTDEYTPLYSSKMTLNIFMENSFDDATKTITYNHASGTGGQVGWAYTTAKDFTAYRYFIMAFNPQANSYYETHLKINNTGTEYRPCNASGTFYDIVNGTKHIDLDMQNCYVKINDVLTAISFDKVNSFAFWDSWEADYQLSLANVFLTNTLPDWDNPVTRTMTSGNYGTVCLPYPAICTDGYVYQIKSVNRAKTQLTIEPYNGVMKPGMPYIFQSIGSGVNFYEIKDSKALASDAGTYNGLVGCLNATTNIANDGKCYVLKDNVWALVNSDNFTSGANRAYVNLDNVSVESTSAKGIVMDLSNEATGINAVNANGNEADVVYTITGVKVDSNMKLQRGVYIRGGKKFVIK
jgi:hypothetical protein